MLNPRQDAPSFAFDSYPDAPPEGERWSSWDGATQLMGAVDPRQPSASSTKHHRHASPGSKERITGWPLSWKCAVACLPGEESQQPTWPHSVHKRK